MGTCNLICMYQGAEVIDHSVDVDKRLKKLKSHEIRTLKSFCNIMHNHGFSYGDFDGYYVGYTIKQIGKEFDLLRFGDDKILNIELKSELKTPEMHQKILEQMKRNYYYLKFLEKPIEIITYVENGEFYIYNQKDDALSTIHPNVVADIIKNHTPNMMIDPDKAFIPSNYLISPFNSTDKFINGEYFLTSRQQTIKKEIKDELIFEPFKYFCISANAGTGKTLLTYDIAKEFMQSGMNVVLIHSGKLNDGHDMLKQKYNWKIYSVASIKQPLINNLFNSCDFLFIDEAQRIRISQLELIINYSKEHSIPIVFSYDPRQYLRDGEDHDVENYIKTYYGEIPISSKKLTNKIRTNKELASFITNLFEIGKSKNDLNYSCVTIDYISEENQLQDYIEYLKRQQGWQPLTYTTSMYYKDPFDSLSTVSDKNAHDVIGQEFSKVVFVMDENFIYQNNRLFTKKGAYYSPKGMLYQITTRVINELKIIVFNNPELYLRLLEIKSMGNI